MDKRLKLHSELCSLLNSENVYYQAPEDIKLCYPCIVYELSGKYGLFANNKRYLDKDEYEISLIAKAPDHYLINRIMDFPYISFNGHYVSDNLHHYNFTIYY